MTACCNACTAAICGKDQYCCQTGVWDSPCVVHFSDYCGGDYPAAIERLNADLRKHGRPEIGRRVSLADYGVIDRLRMSAQDHDAGDSADA